MAERSARPSPPEPEGGLAFRDPAKRRALHFDVLPMAKLEVISHQRKASDAHVKRVMDSVAVSYTHLTLPTKRIV